MSVARYASGVSQFSLSPLRNASPLTGALSHRLFSPPVHLAGQLSLSRTPSHPIRRPVATTSVANPIWGPLLPWQPYHQPSIPGKEHQYVPVVTKEWGQQELQSRWKKVPLQGNALFGCSVLVLLNLASLKPKITHVAAFDIDARVGQCWENIKNIMTENDPTRSTVEDRMLSYFRCDPSAQDSLTDEIEDGVSFLSDEDRFAHARTFFRGSNFSFTPLDICNPLVFAHFIKKQRVRNITPSAIYLSNIASRIFTNYGEPPGGEFHVDKHPKYNGFRASLKSIPDDIPVIDAREPWLGDGDAPYSIQRLHLTAESKERLMPSPCGCLYLDALMNDDYDAVMECLKSGADRMSRDEDGYTPLMCTAEYYKNNSLRALLDFATARRENLHRLIDAQDIRGFTALDLAKSVGNLPAVKLLCERRARQHDFLRP